MISCHFCAAKLVQDQLKRRGYFLFIFSEIKKNYVKCDKTRQGFCCLLIQETCFAL